AACTNAARLCSVQPFTKAMAGTLGAPIDCLRVSPFNPGLADDQRPLVQERHHLLSFGGKLHGCQWGWRRRFPGLDAPARLSSRTGCNGHMADAVPIFPLPRRRL